MRLIREALVFVLNVLLTVRRRALAALTDTFAIMADLLCGVASRAAGAITPVTAIPPQSGDVTVVAMSGMGPAIPGQTGHGDFINHWEPAALQQRVVDCLRAARICSTSGVVVR